MLAALRNKISRLADGSSIVQGVKGMSGEDQAAIATSFVPGVGDVAGAYADYKGISENWARMNALSKTAAVGAAALGAVPFLPSRSQMHAGGAALQDAVQKIKAYHGSPHDFDRFSTSQIGTGEGAQAYGHGLYFAEAEDVARGYRDDLSKNLIKIPDVDPDVQRQLGDSFAMSDFESVADIPADWWEYQAQGLAEGGFPDLAKQLRNADVSKARLSDGSMYQVEIDASPDEFLDWDLPLSEQSDLVRKNMETLGFTDNKKAVNDFDNALLDNLFNDSSKPLPKQPSDLRGEHLYYQSAPKATNPAEASNALSGLGIKGIRYKDEFSRGKEGGTSNYVVFDENLISIARKYGIAIPAAAAMLARQTGQNPQDMYEDDST